MQTAAQVLKPDFTIQERINELKARVHDRLVEILDLRLIDKLEEQSLRQEIRRLTSNILADEGARMPLNAEERERFYREIQDEILGLGPIEPFMQDPSVSDILVNSYRQIYVERHGKAGADGSPLQGRCPPAQDHRQDRLVRGPPHRRVQPHGGCAPSRRLPRQCHHSAGCH